MSCKVRLYFYDSNSGKDVFDEGCKLKVNDTDVDIGTFETEKTKLKFSLSTAIPGNGGYEFEKWGFSQTGVSFTPTNTDTLTQDVTDIPYLEVRCYLKPNTCHIKYRFNNPNTQVDTEQEVLFGDSLTRLIDAPSYTETVDGKKKIQVFVGWKTTESVEDASSITTQYATGTEYSKFSKFWKNDQNDVKTYYQAMADITVAENTSWEAIEDKVYRLGANGEVMYSARGYYTPMALEVVMDAVWMSPDEDSLYPQGEIIYEDEDGNVIGRETAFSGVDVKAGDDGDFKGIASDEWEDESGKKIKKGSTIRTPNGGGSGGGGWSMHFHVSGAVERKYWVKYDARGGVEQPAPEEVNVGDTITLKSLPSKMEKDGTVINAISWRGPGGYYDAGDSYVVNGNVEFTARYPTGREETVTFDPCGLYKVNPKTKKVIAGGKATYGDLPTPQEIYPQPENTFAGWYTSRTGGKLITSSSKILNNGDHTLFAQWEKKKVIHVNPNGGEVLNDGKWTSEEIILYETQGVFIEPVVRRTGYNEEGKDFGGWFTSPAMDAKTQFDPMAKENLNPNPIRIYAKWAQKITFDSNGGTPAQITDKAGYFSGIKYDTVGLPTVSKSGSKFLDWYTQKSGGVRITGASIVSNSKTRTLYAHWATEKQTVTFDPVGGTVEPNVLTFDKDGKYDDLPSAQYVRGGNITQKFLGWFTSKTDGIEVNNGDKVTNDDTRVLYAHYEQRKKVTFFSEGGYISDPSGMKYVVEEYFNGGGTYAEGTSQPDTYHFPAPSRDGGWSFKGWYTDRGGKGTKIEETSKVLEAEEQFLHAYWEDDKQVATITYDYNGGVPYVPGKDVYEGDAAGALPLPRKPGYSPTGWHKQVAAFAISKRDGEEVTGELITAKTIITESMTVKMGWSEKIFLYYAIAPQ